MNTSRSASASKIDVTVCLAFGRSKVRAARLRFLSVEPLLADLGPLDLRKIDWVIVGGESGPHSRPMLRDWVVNIRRQCRAQRVPFFFKQWGGTRKHETGRTLDGRTYDEFPLAFHRVLAASNA